MGQNQAGNQGSIQSPLLPTDSLNLTVPSTAKAMSSVEMALTDKGSVGNPLCGGEALQYLASQEENTRPSAACWVVCHAFVLFLSAGSEIP